MKVYNSHKWLISHKKRLVFLMYQDVVVIRLLSVIETVRLRFLIEIQTFAKTNVLFFIEIKPELAAKGAVVTDLVSE